MRTMFRPQFAFANALISGKSLSSITLFLRIAGEGFAAITAVKFLNSLPTFENIPSVAIGQIGIAAGTVGGGLAGFGHGGFGR